LKQCSLGLIYADSAIYVFRVIVRQMVTIIDSKVKSQMSCEIYCDR